MSPIEVLSRVRQAGGTVKSDGKNLIIEVARGVLTDTDREVLTRHKVELVRLLAPVDPEREAIQWVESLPEHEAVVVVETARREWSEIVQEKTHACLDHFGDPIVTNAERRHHRNKAAKRSRSNSAKVGQTQQALFNRAPGYE